MIGVVYEATDADGRDAVAAFRVLANGQSLGTVSQVRLGWRAVSESGTVLPGLFRKRGDGGDALVEWSGILE